MRSQGHLSRWGRSYTRLFAVTRSAISERVVLVALLSLATAEVRGNALMEQHPEQENIPQKSRSRPISKITLLLFKRRLESAVGGAGWRGGRKVRNRGFLTTPSGTIVACSRKETSATVIASITIATSGNSMDAVNFTSTGPSTVCPLTDATVNAGFTSNAHG
jgi:hypothetical protein